MSIEKSLSKLVDNRHGLEDKVCDNILRAARENRITWRFGTTEEYNTGNSGWIGEMEDFKFFLEKDGENMRLVSNRPRVNLSSKGNEKLAKGFANLWDEAENESKAITYYKAHPIEEI